MAREHVDKVLGVDIGSNYAPKVGQSPQEPSTSKVTFMYRPNSVMSDISASVPSSPDPGEGRHDGCFGGALKFDGHKFADYFRGKARKFADYFRGGKPPSGPSVPNFAAQILAPRARGSGSGIDWEEHIHLATKGDVVRMSREDYENSLRQDPKLQKKRKEFKGKKELKKANLVIAAKETKKTAVAWQILDKKAGKKLRPASRYAQQFDEQYRATTPANHRPNTPADRLRRSGKFRPKTSAELRPMSPNYALGATASANDIHNVASTSESFHAFAAGTTHTKSSVFNPYSHVKSRFRDSPTIDFGNRRQQMDLIEDKEDRAAGVLIQGHMDRVRQTMKKRDHCAKVAENQRKAFEEKPEFGEKRQMEINNLKAAIANNNVRLPANAVRVVAAQGYVWGNFMHTNEFPMDDPDERALSRLAAEIDWIEEECKY